MSSQQMPGGGLALVDVPSHCNNAPRKVVLRDFVLALYNQNLEGVAAFLSDKIRWSQIGSQTREGIDAISRWILNQPRARELRRSEERRGGRVVSSLSGA